MDIPKKLIVGYDLQDDVSQISCYSYKTYEPVTIGPNEEDEVYQIPTVLCLKKDTRLWLFGHDALAAVAEGEGILISGLLEKVRKRETVDILEQSFTAVSLLEKYLRKSLSLLKNYFPTEPITQLVVTVRDTQPELADGIYQALDQMGIEKDRAAVISHTGSYLHYVLNQDRTFWMNDIGLFDYNEDGLCYYQISLNRRTKPIIAGVTKKDLSDTLSYPMRKQKELDLAYTFQNLANMILYKQIISTLYFTGKGFEGDWAGEVMKGLCTGRRVFLGQNLYSYGACYAARELSGERKLEDYVLLNDEMLQASVSLYAYSDARMHEVLLTEAARPWYEINTGIEVIPSGETEMNFIIKNIMTKEAVSERLPVPHFPDRPDRMTRLGINLTFASRTSAKIRVKDLGFGDFCPGTGQTWEYEISL